MLLVIDTRDPNSRWKKYGFIIFTDICKLNRATQNDTKGMK